MPENPLITAIRTVFRSKGTPEHTQKGPTRARETRDVLEAMVKVGPNFRPDLLKQVSVKTHTPATIAADRMSLEDLQAMPELLCLQTRILVESPPAGESGEYVVVYDSTSTMLVYREATFRGEMVPARIVPVESPEAAGAGVVEFDPFEPLGYIGPDAGGRGASVVRRTVNFVVLFYSATQAMDPEDFPGGYPEPGSPAGAAYWREASPPNPIYRATERIKHAVLLFQADDQDYISAGRIYAITDRPNGPETVYAAFDTTESRFCEAARVEGVPGLFRYNLANDQLTEITSGGGTGGPQELNLPQLVEAGTEYWWPTGVFEARSTFQASAAPVNGANWRLVVPFSSYTDAQAQVAATAGQARLIRPNAATLTFATVTAANAPADYGDTVEAIGTQQLASLTLKGGVTYATSGHMVNWNLLTDNGQQVITCAIVGSSPEGRYGGGGLSITGAGSDVVVEKALYPHQGQAVYQTAGRITHRGLLRGGSTSEIMATLSGTADFRHVSGQVRCGGSKGFVLSGNAQALVRADSIIDQQYGRLVECGDTAKIRIEGGSLFSGGAQYALSEVVYLAGGQATLANGTYDNTTSAAPGAFLQAGTLVLDNATMVGNIGGTAGTVILRNGGKCRGTISAALTVVNENATGSGGPNELHISSTNGLRVRRIRLTSHITLLTLLLDDNAGSVSHQVATFSGGTWTGTADLNSLAEAQAALPAAGDAQYATGVALLVKTNPVTAANASNVILTYE